MRADLIRSMIDFRRDLLDELSSLARSLEPDHNDRLDFESYARRWAEWQRTATNAGIVQDLYIWQHGSSHSQLLRIQLPGEEPERVEWPPELEPLRATAVAGLHVPPVTVGSGGPFAQHVEQRPLAIREAGAPGVPPDTVSGIPDSRFIVAQGVSITGAAVELGDGRAIFDVRNEAHGDQSLRKVVRFRERGVVTVGRLPWMVIPSIPALVHPLFPPSDVTKQPSRRCRTACADLMIIPLKQAFLRERLFPKLAARYFSVLDYEVAVVAGVNGDRVVYSSNPKSIKRTMADADASMGLFRPPGVPHPDEAGFAALPRLKGVTGSFKTDDVAGIFGVEEGMEVRPMLAVSPLDGWYLVVNNRRGSLDAAVEAMRWRNLAVSFGVLMILATAIGIIIFAAQRVQALARLQMDFVAGVSHELRTPLTVISSAADNIADGVVKNEQQFAHYGVALKSQVAQLRDLVEQILLFAATRNSRQTYSLRPAQVGDAIDLGLRNTAELIRSAGLAVECHVRRDLPDVFIDVRALSWCLQNLITNAIKYSREGRWIGIWAETDEDRRRVRILVRDHGIGISPEDMKHIFEPFYRSRSVRDAQIHGSGLGLSVAKSIVQAMGGQISVESKLGQGSSFAVLLNSVQALAADRERQTSFPSP
jgi:signal transduction histidine kinase